MPAGSEITSTPSRVSELGSMPFLPSALAAVVTLFGMWMGDAAQGLALISITSCLFAMAVTIRKAGSYLPPSSVFFIASGVFIGGAGYYLLLVDTPVEVELIRDGAGLAMLTNAAIGIYVTASALNNGISWPTIGNTVKERGLRRPPFMLLFWGAGVMVAMQLPITASIVGPPAHAMAVGGVLMVVTWAAARRADQRWFGDAIFLSVVFLLPLAWTDATFVQGGRLMIAGLLIAAFVAWNLFGPSKIQKVFLICLIPVFLLLSGADRAQSTDGEGVSSSTVIAKGDGLASVYAPLETWARMIGPLAPEQRDLLMPRWGETFINTAVLPIPRSMWDSKPIGFGAELTEVFEPKLVKSSHSMAGLTHGEWYANFGYPGLALMVLVIGWFLVWLDRWHSRLAWSNFESDSDWWSLAILICVVSGLGELYWVGSFTAFARGGMAALAVGVSKIVAVRTHRPRDGGSTAGRARDETSLEMTGPAPPRRGNDVARQ